MYSDEVQLVPHIVPAGSKVEGIEDGVRDTREERAAVLIDQSWSIYDMPGQERKSQDYVGLYLSLPPSLPLSLVVRSPRQPLRNDEGSLQLHQLVVHHTQAVEVTGVTGSFLKLHPQLVG